MGQSHHGWIQSNDNTIDIKCWEEVTPDATTDGGTTTASHTDTDFNFVAPYAGTLTSIFVRMDNQGSAIASYTMTIAGENTTATVPAGDNVVEFILASPLQLTAGQLVSIDPEQAGQPQVNFFVSNTIDSGFAFTGSTTADAQVSPDAGYRNCLLYTSPSPRDQRGSRMPSSA